MKIFGESDPTVSPHIDAITRAKCVQLLANTVGFIQADSSPDSVDSIDPNSKEITQLINEIALIREIYGATPEDMQLALQLNDAQLYRGARIVSDEL